MTSSEQPGRPPVAPPDTTNLRMAQAENDTVLRMAQHVPGRVCEGAYRDGTGRYVFEFAGGVRVVARHVDVMHEATGQQAHARASERVAAAVAEGAALKHRGTDPAARLEARRTEHAAPQTPSRPAPGQGYGLHLRW